MNIWAIILLLFSSFKLGVIVCLKNNELMKQLTDYSQEDFEEFKKEATFLLLIDGTVGLICGILLLI